MDFQERQQKLEITISSKGIYLDHFCTKVLLVFYTDNTNYPLAPIQAARQR